MSTPPSTPLPPSEDRGHIGTNDDGARWSTSPFRSFIPWLAAACFAIAAARLGHLYISARAEAALLEQQRELSAVALQAARNQLEAEKLITSQQIADLTQKVTDSSRRLEVEKDRAAAVATASAATSLSDIANLKLIALTPGSPNTSGWAVIAWDSSNESGLLQVDKLPALSPNQEYQLWIVDPQHPAPLDVAVFTTDASGAHRLAFKPKVPVRTPEVFGITHGPKGGVAKPEGEFILAGRLAGR